MIPLLAAMDATYGQQAVASDTSILSSMKELELTFPALDAGDILASKAAFTKLEKCLRADIAGEELLFPRLASRLDRAENLGLHDAWQSFRQAAPTHPHPVVCSPSNPALVGLAAPIVGFADRVFDQMAGLKPKTSGSAIKSPVHRDGPVQDETSPNAAG